MDSSSTNLNLLDALGWTILFGSIYSIVLLILYSRKYPSQRETLTERLLQRRWEGIEVAWVVAAFAGLMVLLPLLYALAGGTDTPLAQFLIVLVYSTLLLIILIAIGCRRGSSWIRDFGMSPRQLRLLPFSLAIYLAIVPVIGGISLLYNDMLERLFGVEVEMQDVALLIAESRSWLKIGLILLSVLIAPLYEELIFRGVLFTYLLRWIGFARAMLLVSVLFATVHFHLPTMLPLFLLSIALCYTYWRIGSLWISIGIHALFNSVSIAILLLTA